MMALSRRKVGIKGITIPMIRKWILSPKTLTDREVLFERDAESGREDAVAEVITNLLHISPNELEESMDEVYITSKGGLIVWLVATEEFVKKIFRHAAKIRDEDISFIPHIPAAAKSRRKAIETRLNEQRTRPEVSEGGPQEKQ